MQHTQTCLKLIQCLSESGLKVFEDTNNRIKAVKGEAIAGCRDKKWSVMMHLMALSTVIGRPIFSFYPECNTNTRPLCHKEILPRDYGTKNRDISVNKAMILWSRDSNLDNRPGSWYEPNHFVPIFIQGNVQQPPTTTALEKNQRDGVEKRKWRKISDFFIKQHSLQSEEESAPPVKKQCLEENERNLPKHRNNSEKKVYEEKAQIKASPEGKEWQNKEREVWNEEAARLIGPLERSVSLGWTWFYQRCNVLQGMWGAIKEFDFSQSLCLGQACTIFNNQRHHHKV